jgi:hypothetical protein
MTFNELWVQANGLEDNTIKLADDNKGDWLPPRPQPQIWNISSFHIPHILGTHIGLISSFNNAAEPLDPVYIANTHFPATIQDFLVRLKQPTLNHIPYAVRYENVYIIPKALRTAFGMTIAQKWPVYNAIPPSLPSSQTVICIAEMVSFTTLPFHPYDIPVLQCTKTDWMNLRIRQDSYIQLVCPSEDNELFDPAYVTSLRVKGSRGFTADLKYEILELNFVQLEHEDPMKYAWLYVPPPYVHEDVVMIVEPFSVNSERHDEIMAKWEEILYAVQSDWIETAEVRKQRSSAVWAVMLWYLLRRRQQHL